MDWCVEVRKWERERERQGNSWKIREKERGNIQNSNFFKFLIMRESFTRSRQIGDNMQFHVLISYILCALS